LNDVCNRGQQVASCIALLCAGVVLVSCAHGPKLGTVTDVEITSRLTFQYDDPRFAPCANFHPSVRDVTRFLTTAVVMQPGDIDDVDSDEPCSVSGDATVEGTRVAWRMNSVGVGAVSSLSPYAYRPLVAGGARGVQRARTRLLAIFGPDHFTPAPRQPVSVDAALRNRAASAGLPAVRDGEVRVWFSSATMNRGVSTFQGELIEHQFAYRIDAANEMHGRSKWVRSRLPPELADALKKAAADVVDLNGMRFECAQELDGFTMQVEAMVNGTRVILEASDPDGGASDACRRAWALGQPLWDATRR
jgi:hypothetical protein